MKRFIGRTWQYAKDVGSKCLNAVMGVSSKCVKVGKFVIAGAGVGAGYVIASANLAYAQLTPNFVLDFAQAETDFKSAALSVLTFSLVVYGFYQLWRLIQRK
jgi:hypothetical protein